MRCTSLLFAPFLALPLRADEPKWDVNAPPGPATKFALDVREGTWIALDVSPDGQELAFDLLGDIYLLPIEGGEARASEQKDLGEPAFSPDGRYVYFSYDSTPGGNFEYSKDSNGQIYAIDRLDRTTGERVTLVSGPGGA